MLIDGPVYVLHWCAGALVVQRCAQPKTDGNRNQLCEKCDRRLSTVKHHRVYGPGRACAPRCKSSKRAVDEGALKQPPAVRPHKRAKSDPGEAIPLTATRTRPHRITAPQPPPPTPKPRTVKPVVDTAALLDQAHARRMALIEAEKSGAGSSATNGSAVVWQ